MENETVFFLSRSHRMYNEMLLLQCKCGKFVTVCIHIYIYIHRKYKGFREIYGRTIINDYRFRICPICQIVSFPSFVTQIPKRLLLNAITLRFQPIFISSKSGSIVYAHASFHSVQYVMWTYFHVARTQRFYYVQKVLLGHFYKYTCSHLSSFIHTYSLSNCGNNFKKIKFKLNLKKKIIKKNV